MQSAGPETLEMVAEAAGEAVQMDTADTAEVAVDGKVEAAEMTQIPLLPMEREMLMRLLWLLGLIPQLKLSCTMEMQALCRHH